MSLSGMSRNTPTQNLNKLKPQMTLTHTTEWAKSNTVTVNMNPNNRIKPTPRTHRGKRKNTTNIISKLKVLTINVRGVKCKQASLTSVLHTHGTHVAAITETHLDKNETLSINGYHWCGKNRDSKGGGIGLLIRNDIQSLLEEQETQNA